MAAVYFHYPFCRQACHYCNFHFSTQLNHQDDILEAFEGEILLRKNEIPTALESVYFGGGSPSLLNPESIERLLHFIEKFTPINNEMEVTVEVNPDDVSELYLKQLRSIGVNRISMGLQSFSDLELRMMNRVHDAGQGIRAREWTAEYFDNFSVDMIYGIPSSDISSWQQNLEHLLTYDPPHLSCYALTVEPKTVLAHRVKNEEVIMLDDDTVKSQYDSMVHLLEQLGYENYEFSNFAKEGYYSVNNSNYWNGKPYMGIGPAAHSFDGKRKRSWNVSNNIKYIKSIREERLPAEHETLRENEAFNEYIMTSLRTSAGVSIDRINQSFGIHYSSYLEKQAEKHIIDQRLYWNGDVLKVSKKARFLTDGIASDLFLLKN
jgi:oxygen-independent coproporphyrinogen-3 oxidase